MENTHTPLDAEALGQITECHHIPSAAPQLTESPAVRAAFDAGRLAGLRQAHEVVAAQGGRIDSNNPIQVAEAALIDQCLIAIVDEKKRIEPSIRWKDEIDADDAFLQLAGRINPARRRDGIIALRGAVCSAQSAHRPGTVAELVEIAGTRFRG